MTSLGPRWAIRRVALALAAALTVVVSSAAPAAAGTFPVIESFQNATAPGWTLGGAAQLTAPSDGAGNGWLRLTPASQNKAGYAFYDTPFASNEGILVDFDYAMYGGTGADGITFFLYDGTTSASQFQIGAFGGGLGYVSCGSTAGLKNAYLGIGLDQWGNYTNVPGCGLDSTGFHPNYLSVRGSQTAKYPLLASTAVPKGLNGTRAASRHVTLSITPAGKLSVTLRFPDGTFQTAVSNVQLPAAPATLKLGYAAATGGSTNIHEIRTTGTVKPTDLVTTVTDGQTGATRGAARTWTATVTNQGPNPATGASVVASTGAQSLTGVTWTCTASGGADCGAAASGSGLPNVAAGAVPIGGALTYAITGTPSAGTDFAQLTVNADPTGDTGDLAPADNQATDTTALTPVFDAAPSVTLAPSGTATATPAAPRGGSVTSTYVWLRCDADGTGCAAIPGETALTYATTVADRGRSLRVRQSAANPAGTTSQDSAAYAALPATALTSSPSGPIGSGAATFVFSSMTVGATFQCSVDGGTFAACSSPHTVGGLGDGAHTFAVRAVAGGLTDPTPQTASWTVDTAAPTTSITAAPPAQTASRSADFTFDGTDPSGTGVGGFECRLDGGSWATCTSTWTVTGLLDGDHTAEIRALDAAGNPDAAPPAFSWTVDGTAPQSTFGVRPPATASSGTATFTFFGDDGAGTGVDGFECSLDSGAWEPCTSPQVYTGLADGIHTAEVRATDLLGNVQSNPAWYGWTVDLGSGGPTTPPTTPGPTTPTTPDPTTPDPTTPDPTTPTTPDPTTPTTPGPTTPPATTPDPTTPDPTTPTTPDPTTPTTPDPTTPTTPDPTTPTTPDPTTPTTPDPTSPTTPTTPTTPGPTTPTTPAPTSPTTPTTPGPSTPTTPAPTTPTTPTTPGPSTPTPPAPTTPTTPAPTTPTTPAPTTPAPTTPAPTTPAPTTPAPTTPSRPSPTPTPNPGTAPLLDLTLPGAKAPASATGSAAGGVGATTGLKAAPLTLTARIGKRGALGPGRRITVVCKVSVDSIKVCNVKVYARIGRRVVQIGAGRRAIKQAGHRTLGVKVALNVRGRRLMASRATAKVSLRVRSQPFTRPKVAVNVKGKIHR